MNWKNWKSEEKWSFIKKKLICFQLFDHIAECLANFMREHDVAAERLPLGFTFSFPLRQKALTTGLLECWTKGFNCSGVIGEDVVRLLKEALKRRNVSHFYSWPQCWCQGTGFPQRNTRFESQHWIILSIRSPITEYHRPFRWLLIFLLLSEWKLKICFQIYSVIKIFVELIERYSVRER